MLFYSIEARMPANSTDAEEPQYTTDLKNDLQAKTEAFYTEQDKNCHIAMSRLMYKKKRLVMCAAVRSGILSADTVRDYIKTIEFDVEKIEIQEITLTAYCNMLQQSSRYDYIEDDDIVYEQLGISKLSGRRYHRSIEYAEALIKPAAGKTALLRKTEELLCDSSLRTEIERIYQSAIKKVTSGHPVHYLLQSDDKESRDQMLRVLLSALSKNERIQSRRYTEVSCNGDDSLSKEDLKALYEACTDGTVVVSFAEEDTEDSDHARVGADVIEILCSIMREYRNKVLTVFCLKRKAEKVKNAFMERIGAVTIIQIAQETVFCDRAKQYLRLRAKEHGATPDKSLYRKVADGKGYTAADLNLAYDEWYDRYIKAKVYIQYAELETANKQFSAHKPRGSAIDELMQMVGLEEAKKVIYQALDFYKAQELFRVKGFMAERPAMHMVFTGNPGTAKTTVARLFAQIMKDNNLLSVGDLFEVGRSDLVGKYVGWTAQIVKQKFKAAKGSVLFIDEAYSLVDGKDGYYGDEAINTIVQEMENHREDMIVIFAGYPDKMEGFLQKNPGLRSRIAFHVPFADYNTDELYQITELLAEKQDVTLGDGTRDKLTAIYETCMKSDDFGNGRFARNLFEKAVMKQASRLVSMNVDNITKADICTLLAEDFDAPPAVKQELRKIGF